MGMVNGFKFLSNQGGNKCIRLAPPRAVSNVQVTIKVASREREIETIFLSWTQFHVSLHLERRGALTPDTFELR